MILHYMDGNIYIQNKKRKEKETHVNFNGKFNNCENYPPPPPPKKKKKKKYFGLNQQLVVNQVYCGILLCAVDR